MTGNEPRIELSKLLNGAQLPALPQSAIRLLELSQDPDNGPIQFAKPIESDPGLTSQVLRFVNSSYFGFRQEISSVKLAISLVGIRTIKNFALWSAVFSLMPNPKCGPFDLKHLWQDSLRRGIFSRRLGKILKLAEAEDLFAAALLQDMGVPLLAKEMPVQYQKLLENRQDGQKRLSDLERELFGWTHAEAGATIARNWHLPESFAELIGSHNEITEPATAGPTTVATIVALSALLPTSCDSQWCEREAFMTFFDRITAGYDATVQLIFEDVGTEFEEFAPMLKLAQPARSLLSYLEDDLLVV